MKPRKSTKPPDIVYRVIANIDSRFESPAAAMAAYEGRLAIPAIPETTARLLDEDETTPRVCVAGRLEDCFTAIGLLGRFRRCLSANKDALSYAMSGNEVYPIIVQTFDGRNAMRPSREQVPDWPWTNEFWITEPVHPLSTELKWLDMYSIRMASVPETEACPGPPYACKSVCFVEPTENSAHPWLNGKGHVLESSEYEAE